MQAPAFPYAEATSVAKISKQGRYMKTISAIAATALLLSVTAATAQAPSSGASQPGATTNTDKEVPAKGVPADKNAGSTVPGSSGAMPTASSGASQTGSTTNTDKEVPAKGVAADKNMGSSAPATSGAASGTTGGSNQNPTTNKNPDSEVPGKKQ